MQNLHNLIKEHLGNPNDNPNFHKMSYDLIKNIALLKDEAYGEDYFTFFMDRFLFNLGNDVFFSKLNRLKVFEVINKLFNFIYCNNNNDEIIFNHKIKDISYSSKSNTYHFTVTCSSSGFKTKVSLKPNDVECFYDDNEYTLTEEITSLQLFDEDDKCYFDIRTAPYKLKGEFQDINFNTNLNNLNHIRDINSFFIFLKLFKEEKE